MNTKPSSIRLCIFLAGSTALMLSAASGKAQGTENAAYSGSFWSQPGIIGAIILASIVVIVGLIIVSAKVGSVMNAIEEKKERLQGEKLKETLANLDEDQINDILEKRKKAMEYRLAGNELSGGASAEDSRGLINKVTSNIESPLVDEKKKTRLKVETDPRLSGLVIAYLVCAAFWLVLGTTVGEYLGMKFVFPDMDHVAWLTFGRLRPVHTNTVFWGWSSLAMIGLGYYVVARTSNTRIHNIKWGWTGLFLINASVLIGDLSLMAGINNGGGEYREYIWPVMLLFVIGLFITFLNYYKTIANRKTPDIYISNWYILAACLWTMVLVTIAYLPFYQNGMGETVIQGYYMHQGVGMWFMTFTLGLVYYFLPSALNKPIYSYSLGVLGFWTQLLFYTLIGTHHFIFSPIPWYLQTIAIVFSGGMVITVVAGTTNFLMTMKGSWKAIGNSYVLPFMLVGVIFYFVGSTQGSLEAFRFTNLIWHFTDYTVAHSHMTMYGIIAFFLWGSVYALLPRITGREPKQLLVGIHFWLAFVGMIAYTFSLMIGGTEKGISWMDQRPFLESVELMAPYYIWRGVGGSLMLISHFIFAFNIYKMVYKEKVFVKPAIA